MLQAVVHQETKENGEFLMFGGFCVPARKKKNRNGFA
jgi:hypothetical protein